MPCDDEVVNARGYDFLLAMEFGEPIDARGGSRLGLLTRCVVGVGTKDVVSADMDKQTTHLLHRAGKVFGGNGVKCLHNVTSGLSFIDVGPGRTVDDAADLLLGHHLTDGVQIGDVEGWIAITHIGEDVVVAARTGHELHFVAQLAVGSCYQYIHDDGSVCLSGRATYVPHMSAGDKRPFIQNFTPFSAPPIPGLLSGP